MFLIIDNFDSVVRMLESRLHALGADTVMVLVEDHRTRTLWACCQGESTDIDELERSRRGLYTGSIGYLSARGGCDFNIVIRTAVWEDGAYTLGVGGGITYDSDSASEFDECLLKAKAVLEAIGAGGTHVRR